MKQAMSRGIFHVIRWLVKLFSPRFQVEGTDNIPREPCIVVGNHSQMYGPIACELYLPERFQTWCAGQMMHWKEVPAYAYADFWSQKPGCSRWFYKILSYLIVPICVCVFNNARTIAVYRDGRIISTFKHTVSSLAEGNHVVIFPEHDVLHNHILYDFQDKFIDIARLYHKRTGKSLSFVPMYIAPKLKKMVLGTPIVFQSDAPIQEERVRIKEYLMSTITGMAEALPEHTVVPYRNIPKKLYPSNKAPEVSHENTRC